MHRKIKLIIDSIAILLNEITQTDGQQCGIFRHVERDDVDKDYANQQIIDMIKKYKNSFLPTKGVFQIQNNNSTRTSATVIEGSETQLRKQKRMRITSNREKFLRINGNKTVQCVESPQVLDNGM